MSQKIWNKLFLRKKVLIREWRRVALVLILSFTLQTKIKLKFMFSKILNEKKRASVRGHH